MDDEFFGGVNPMNTNEPQNNSDEHEKNEQPQSKSDGEYHYNRQQYNQQFGSDNNVSRNYSQQYNNTNSYNQGFNSFGGYNNGSSSENPYSQQNMNGGYSYNPMGNAPKKKSPGMKVFIIIIAAILIFAGILMAVFLFDGDGEISGLSNETVSDIESDNNSIDNVDDIEASEGSLSAGEAAEVAKIAKKYNVGILVYANNSLYTEGSGVVLKEDNDGKYTYIVTCAHVVNYSNVALSVLMEDGTEYPADLVGMDTRTDLAVVRIEASGLDKADIADSDNLIVGQQVYAVGNPGGSEFFGSVTNGIISAIDRPVSSSTGYEMECIQHTSAINPGNSGGALVNGEGQLIGINSMKIASTEYEGMGFAVPSSVVIDVFNSIIENGFVAGRAKLGISYTTPSGYSQTYAMYVQMKGLPTGTIVIAEVNEDSDLANKDVKAGDMIIAVNGKEMTDADMLSEMIEDMSAGDSLTLTIVRVNTEDWSQTEHDVKVTLVEDRGTSSTQTPENENSGSENPFGNYGGEGYQDWYDFYREFFGY